MARAGKALENLIEPAVTALGYELVGAEFHSQGGRGGLLRLYIDAEAGITLDDCERVSRQVSAVLEVEDPIPGRYTLEVSSPGLDRPLFSAAHYNRFLGRRARLRLQQPVEGRRKITGVIVAVRDETVVLEEDGAEYAVPLVNVEKANLVPEN
ncbi:ribosome maturation factor RimP [Ectothiorhodospiraceae bacterium 2226]|nr:ribosome maturation factor RimP [Ectothiorhodospiraceae bacterium 2226]